METTASLPSRPSRSASFALAIGLLMTLNFQAALRTPPRVGWNVSVTVQVAAGASVGQHDRHQRQTPLAFLDVHDAPDDDGLALGEHRDGNGFAPIAVGARDVPQQVVRRGDAQLGELRGGSRPDAG